MADGSRNENSAEHSWHIALMAIVLGGFSNDRNLDLLKTIKMLLVHDIVEIDVGDTIGDELFSLWIEFEERITLFILARYWKIKSILRRVRTLYRSMQRTLFPKVKSWDCTRHDWGTEALPS